MLPRRVPRSNRPGPLALRAEVAGSDLAGTVRIHSGHRPETVWSRDSCAGPPRYATYQIHPQPPRAGPWRPPHGGLPQAGASFLFYPIYPIPSSGPLDSVCIACGNSFRRPATEGGVIRPHTSQSANQPYLERFFRSRAEGLARAQGIPLADAFRRLVPG